MIVSLNGYTINDPSSTYNVSLEEPVDGLDIPEIRTSSGNYSGRSGGYVSAQFMGMRVITLNGWVYNGSAATVDQIRRDMQAALFGSSSVTVNITTNGGNLYTLTANVTDFAMPIQRSVNKAPYQIQLLAPDPIIYDASAGGMSSVNVPLATGGGMTWPITWPITWASGSQPVVVNNTGNVAVYPKITMTNKMTNPTVTNQTTGQYFTLTGLTTTTGDVLVIDMKNRTVLLNGGTVLPRVTSTSSWWPLMPGNNSINLTSNDGTDTVVAAVSWQAGYRGI